DADGAIQGNVADNVCKTRGGSAADLHEVQRTGLEGEVTQNQHARAGAAVTRRIDATAGDNGVADDPCAEQRAARVDGGQARLRDIAIDPQDAAIDRGGAGIGVRAGED